MNTIALAEDILVSIRVPGLPTRGSALAGVRAPAWGGGAALRRKSGARGKSAVGPLLEEAAGTADGSRVWAAGARALGLWSIGNLGAKEWSAVQMIAEPEAMKANYE